jgi:MFS family permease
MLFRFCLYGFLKNQRYFEPFLVLAFLEKGLSFTQIGLLIGFREICVNVMEVPTGAVADVLGRRRAMILSFLAYMVSFAIFGLAGPSSWLMGLLLAAMFFFSVGEAFRTGTHKAIIFDWLASQGRAGEKTRVYGFTRSWSKLGSALNAIVAAALVFVTRQYSSIFLFSLIPYAMNIVNFLTYPSDLDGPRAERASVGGVVRLLVASLRDCLRRGPLRRLLAEGMSFDGAFKIIKDYLQPVLENCAALAAPALVLLVGPEDSHQQIAVFVAVVYVVLHLLSSFASRRADAFRQWAGDEGRAARRLWWVDLGVFAVLVAAVVLGLPPAAIAAFVALSFIQNFWRPIMVSRFAEHAESAQMATILSVESQARSLFAAVLAPLLGLAVDAMRHVAAPVGGGDLAFLPVGLVGLAIAVAMLATGRRPATPVPAADGGDAPS